MSDMIKREDVLRIIDGRFSGMMIGDIYVCDRKKCEDCNPLCDFTRDINHAGTIDKALIIDKKKEDIKLAPKGRQCKIDRCELFNRLATITAEDANDMKAKIYAVIQEMPAIPERVTQPVHVHVDTEEILEKVLEKIREEYELTDDIVRCKECKYEPICNHSVQHTTHDAYSVTIGSKTVEWCSYGERSE